jgi:hypothetical protein
MSASRPFNPKYIGHRSKSFQGQGQTFGDVCVTSV